MNLSEHFQQVLSGTRSYVAANTMGAIAHLCQEVEHFDPSAKVVLTNENARIVGEFLLSLTENSQKAAGFSLSEDRSGCGEKITYIAWRDREMLMHFAGDRCNSPASPTEWCWIRRN